MIKNIVLLFNILALFFFKSLFQNGPEITHNFPDTIQPGEEITVDVVINKEQITGFAKLQFDLPEGFIASVIEARGASYSFKDQKAKFIWMSLPAEKSFSVTFKVKADESASGGKILSGEFSYLENNEKKTYTLPSKPFSVGGENEPSTITENIKEVQQEEVKTKEEKAPPTESAIPETIVTQNNIEKTLPPTSTTEITIKREIDNSNISQKELTINITVSKGTISGFSKLQETLPAGFTAKKIETKGATFAFDDQKVKFLWMNLPSDEVFNISYKIILDEGLTGIYYINGEFSYLENGETKKKTIDQGTIDLSASPIEPIAETKKETKEETPKTETAKVENKTVETQKTTPPVTSTPAPVAGLHYRVQVAASHIVVEPEYFQKKNSIMEPIIMEMHEGWNKYTTGNFQFYKDARDKRVYINENHNITGPFVTAYNDGNRITVQEALMLSQQKWVK